MSDTALRSSAFLGTSRERRRFSTLVLSLLAVLIGWSALVASSFFWNSAHLRDEKVRLATVEARALWNKDLAIRRWLSKQGGVYIRISQTSSANPFLAHLSDRDVMTTDGTALTLIDPATMMRRMTEEQGEAYGIRGKITALHLINPQNEPDRWEKMNLERFMSGEAREAIEQAVVGGKPVLRFMKAMMMQAGCEQCHTGGSYENGEVFGGISVSVPLKPYFEAARQSTQTMAFSHVTVWLLGLAGLAAFSQHAKRKQGERRALLGRLREAALYDKLTGLPTRRLFEERIVHALNFVQRHPGERIAVCFIDLDRFKQINDSYGHAVGDALLSAVSRRLMAAVRPSDTVARLGGDEYVVLLERIREPAEAAAVARRIAEEVNEPIVVGGQRIDVGVSIGIAFGKGTACTAEALIRHADIAMYRAKNSADREIVIFDEHMQQALRDRTAMEMALRMATTSHSFELRYQPIVDVGCLDIVGFEALLRWRHGEQGFVPPDTFIPIAEDIGLISDIGIWVIETAARQMMLWQRQAPTTGGSPPFVAVNLSARQLVDVSLTNKIADVLLRTGLSPTRLHLEITETALVIEQEELVKTLTELRRLGCQFSADDFGTGYSSLTYLQRYRFDCIKIDRRFVQDIDGDGKGRQLCRALIGLAEDLDLEVVAEGVETPAQAAMLRGFGCHLMQGFLFFQPLAADQVNRLCANGLRVGGNGIATTAEGDVFVTQA